MLDQGIAFRDHFSEIARYYNQVRTTDVDPVPWIKNIAGSLTPAKGLEIGAGGGRYSRLLLHEIEGLDLTCLDLSQRMIAETHRILAARGKNSFRCVCTDCLELPFQTSSFNLVFTFNAVHHFDFPQFLRETGRVLCSGGWIFIYTRLREQNSENIWGRFFPKFAAREKRLYDMEYLKAAFEQSRMFDLKYVKTFRYPRESSVDRLVDQAKAHHYSTFCLYDDDELEHSLAEFQENVVRHCGAGNSITWTDENILLVAKVRDASKNGNLAQARES